MNHDSGMTLEQIIDEYLAQVRQGVAAGGPEGALPAQELLGQYVDRFPRLAEELGPALRAVVVMEQIGPAEALSYAHGRGVIHRDIKPSNLLVDADGVVWVTDFGLAKTDAEAITQSGDFVGTLHYMSPERFQGACDERADIYSLGLTLYELLALRPAFSSSDRLKLIDRICNQTPPPPRKFDPRIPLDLETVVLKAIDKDPRHRYSCAEEMAVDLRRFLEDKPVLARRVSPPERLWRWSRRNKRLAGCRTTKGVLAAVALLLLTLAIGSTVAAHIWVGRETRLRRAAEIQRDENRRNLYYAQMNLAGQAAAEPGGIGTVRELIARWRPEVAGLNVRGEDLRGWEWYFLDALAHRERYTLRGHDQWVWSVSWSPDGTKLASSGNDGTVRIWDAATGRQLRIIRTDADRSVNWSPNSSWLASGGFRGEIIIWDALTG